MFVSELEEIELGRHPKPQIFRQPRERYRDLHHHEERLGEMLLGDEAFLP